MSTQTQIRRGTAAQCAAMTPASSEVIHDTTNQRLRIGNGLLAGGLPVPNYIDIQNNVMIAGNASGTNVLSVTLSPAPPAGSYQPFFTVRFKAANTSTSTAPTMNVNSMGAQTIRKISGGSISSLVAGDIVAGGIYDVCWDGSQWILINLQNTGIVSVSQGDLNTSTGSVSIATNSSGSGSTLVLPGGSYGFYPQLRGSTSGSGNQITGIVSMLGSVDDATGLARVLTEGGPSGGISTSYTSYIFLYAQTVSVSPGTMYAQQRYITSSPPYDLGDGEVGGFFYAAVDANGDIKATYLADAPPWAYNGPTDIRSTHKCLKTGDKYRRVLKKRSLEQIMDGAPIEYKEEKITHEIKNKDMDLIPHPFASLDPSLSIVLLDPMDDKIRRLVELQNNGLASEVESVLYNKIKVDNSECKRKCPKGVGVHKMKYKFTKKF